MYVREARRMISDYVMTQHNCQGRVTAPDSIGLAAYGMDSHNTQRYVKDGHAINEGDVQVHGFSPYPISYRSIIPKKRECSNLLVPVCVSSTHISYGSIRMEPVFMVLGQSAATAASLAIDGRVDVQDIDIPKLQERLTRDRQILVWTGPTRPAPVDPTKLPGIVVDDTKATKTGDWDSSSSVGGFVGDGYLHDADENKGKKSLRFTVPIKTEGTYDVRLGYTAASNRAENVPVTISGGTESLTRRINQRKPPEIEGRFVSLVHMKLNAGAEAIIEISNQGTNGHVVVDAVQLVPVNN
jgi:hypothetical protein